MSQRWTAEEEAILTAAYRGGLPLEDIAATHNRSVGAIKARLHQLDLIDYGPYTVLVADTHPLDAPEAEKPANTGQPWSHEDETILVNTHKKHNTPEALIELAVALKRTPRSLALKLVQLGEVTPQPNPNPKPRTQAPPEGTLARRARPAAEPTGPSVRVTITPEFQTAAAAVMEGENLLILGSAGTGKSTFLKWLRKKLNGHKKYAVLAPTGMAALNVGGQTIHSFFGFKPELITSAESWRKPRNPKLFKALDVIIVDEISMVRADVFSAMDAFLRHYGPNPHLPFGGVQMVLMGDLCQLPPVVRADEATLFASTFSSPFFFSTPSWQQGGFHSIQFTHIFRQSSKPFINLLTHIRQGDTTPEVLEQLNKRVGATVPDGAVILASRNQTVDRINQTELGKLGGQTFIYSAKTTGTADPKNFTTPAELTLKVGARVMFTKNDTTLRWVNGSTGTVTACDADSVTVKMLNGETHTVEKTTWETIRYELDSTSDTPTATVAGSFTQLPLTLAWAVTIHKAQGQTLPACILDLSDGGTFAEGQMYVALSRATALESLSLTTPIQPRHIKTHPAVKAFYHALNG